MYKIRSRLPRESGGRQNHGGMQRETLFAFGNSVLEFWTTFQEIPFLRKFSVWEDQNRLTIYIPTEISGFLW